MVSSDKANRADLTLFAERMRQLAPLTKEDLAAIAVLMTARKLAVGEHFLRAGEQASDVAMITHGSMREYYQLADGSERTKAFVFAGELTGSLADLLSGAPSTSFVVAERGTRLLAMPFLALRELGAARPRWDQVMRILVERLYLKKARREYELLALDADGRYAALQGEHPEIDAQVSAGHIASYLGITPVHLSRLRRRRRAALAPRRTARTR